MRNLLKGLALSLLLVALAAAAFGQAVSGDLVGTVSDKSGAVIANAKVEVVNLGTGFRATVNTNGQGEYRFSNLAVGHYSVEATAPGLKGGNKDVLVQLNKIVTANIGTALSSAGEVVEVTGGAATIDTTTQQIQSTFDTKENEDLPTATQGL
jgi:hypothetical protein